jgi:hypothetical protein
MDWFGLVIGFIGLLKLVTTINYSAIADSQTLKSPQHTLSLLSLPCLHRLSPGNGSQRHRFLSFRVPRLRSSLAGAYLRTQFTVFSQGLFLTPSRTTLPIRRLKTVCMQIHPVSELSHSNLKLVKGLKAC